MIRTSTEHLFTYSPVCLVDQAKAACAFVSSAPISRSHRSRNKRLSSLESCYCTRRAKLEFAETTPTAPTVLLRPKKIKTKASFLSNSRSGYLALAKSSTLKANVISTHEKQHNTTTTIAFPTCRHRLKFTLSGGTSSPTNKLQRSRITL